MKLRAHVPTQQYGFMEIEGDPEEAREIERLYNHYAETPVKFKSANSPNAKRVECLVGGSILYDPVAHIYTNDAGDDYLSGSAYAKQFDKPFDMQAIASKMEAKSGVPASEIIAIWKLKGQASASFGTSVHEAMELFGKHKNACITLDKEYHVSAIPVINAIVADFFKGREKEEALYEPMIADHKRKWAGQIDRLIITGDKKCVIGDYKTNADMTPAKIETYTHQLSFYASIMEAGGWTVEGMELYHLDTTWKTIKLERKAIKE